MVIQCAPFVLEPVEPFRPTLQCGSAIANSQPPQLTLQVTLREFTFERTGKGCRSVCAPVYNARGGFFLQISRNAIIEQTPKLNTY